MVDFSIYSYCRKFDYCFLRCGYVEGWGLSYYCYYQLSLFIEGERVLYYLVCGGRLENGYFDKGFDLRIFGSVRDFRRDLGRVQGRGWYGNQKY